MRNIKDFKLKIEEYKEAFRKATAKVKDEKSLQELRNLFLSRKRGYLRLLFDELKTLKPDEKPKAGHLINGLKSHVQKRLQSLEKRIKRPKKIIREIDLTLPGRNRYWGAPHPVLLFQDEIEKIFLGMGFSIEDGPERDRLL